MSYLHPELPPISLSHVDHERLGHLADVASDTYPQVADFLAREVARASILLPGQSAPGLVVMGSTVDYRDETTGQTRRVTLVYPHEADVTKGRISVLTPVGAALIGLTIGQSIEWQMPSGGWRSLTLLKVHDSAA
ncbi:MAG TPA: nucleoside diphosphate kinase regulator [Xanthobacteraceae bacterium]|nr:nucleoside diphosphate kinase regulator [Xanthobacteraceae bacterium]